MGTADVNSVARWLAYRGFSVEFRMGRPPDDDVIFMAHATHFFQGGGGFSRLIGGLVEHMGGRVYTNYTHESSTGACVGVCLP